MLKNGFWDAVKNVSGEYDRKYSAEDMTSYFKGITSESGLYKFVGNRCEVVPNTGMNIYVKDGKGQIKFHWFELTTYEDVVINPSHLSLNRWTAVVLRYDKANRQISVTTIDGIEATDPTKPSIVRTDTIYDLCLAYVYVGAGVTEIVAANIIDQRNSELCGWAQTLLDNGKVTDFAAIRIEYPVGDDITVTHNGLVDVAPDKTGVWLYGCDGVGTYIIKNGDISKQVTITTKGQIEQVYISQQVVNYQNLYFLGDECTDITGGWTYTAQAESDRFVGNFKSGKNININSNGYSFCYMFIGATSSGIFYYNSVSINNCDGAKLIEISGSPFDNHFVISNYNVIANTILDIFAITASYNRLIGSKNTNHLLLKHVNYSDNSRVYCMGLCKTDDISFMSAYGSTIAEILTNAVELFKDAPVLLKMVSICTGDFMISALANSNFVNAMNVSPNKTILQANTHWAKFLQLLTV